MESKFWQSITSYLPGWKYRVVLFLLLFSVLSGSYIAFQLINQQFKREVLITLSTVLNTTNQAINTWANEQKISVESFSKNPILINATRQLLSLQKNNVPLLDTKALTAVRNLFQEYLEAGQYRGFFILAPDNTNIASSRNSNIGKINLLIQQKDVLKELWAGKTTFSAIQTSDVPIVEHNLTPRNKSLFVGAPIRDVDGKIIALSLLRIDPYKDLFPLMHAGYLGKTGETYAFNDNGLMISPSRFYSQL